MAAENIASSMAATASMPGQTASNQISQFKEFLQLFNKISEQCFTACVNDFSSRKVSTEENNCSIACLTKHLQSTQRISRRFQEEFIEQQMKQ